MSLEKEFITMLETKEVSADEVYRLYNEALKNFKKSKEYKKIRQELIKNECDTCGENTGLRLVTCIPFPYVKHRLLFEIKSDIKNKIKNKTTVTDEEIEQSIKNAIYEKDGCPNCEHRSLITRTTTEKKYKCGKCHFEFDIPKKVKMVDLGLKLQLKNKDDYMERLRDMLINRKVNIEYNYIGYTDEAKEEQEELLKIYLISWLKDNEINKENSMTLCKRCHYMILLQNYAIPPKILVDK